MQVSAAYRHLTHHYLLQTATAAPTICKWVQRTITLHIIISYKQLQQLQQYASECSVPSPYTSLSLTNSYSSSNNMQVSAAYHHLTHHYLLQTAIAAPTICKWVQRTITLHIIISYKQLQQLQQYVSECSVPSPYTSLSLTNSYSSSNNMQVSAAYPALTHHYLVQTGNR